VKEYKSAGMLQGVPYSAAQFSVHGISFRVVACIVSRNR